MNRKGVVESLAARETELPLLFDYMEKEWQKMKCFFVHVMVIVY